MKKAETKYGQAKAHGSGPRMKVCDVCMGDREHGETMLNCTGKGCKALAHEECGVDPFECNACASGIQKVYQKNASTVRQRHLALAARQRHLVHHTRDVDGSALAHPLRGRAASAVVLASLPRETSLRASHPEILPGGGHLNLSQASAASLTNVTLIVEGIRWMLSQFESGVEGIRWMLSQFESGVGGILADEMGLGKTIQTLAFLAHLQKGGVQGPHLIVLRIVKVAGSRSERDRTLSNPLIAQGDFDVMITTYEYVFDIMINMYETVQSEERLFMNTLLFTTLTIDEGQRLKNSTCLLSKALTRVATPFRLLLTGTPIQNNLAELAALLGFCLPQIMAHDNIAASVAAAWSIKEGAADGGVALLALRSLLQPLMLRRMKADVEKSLLPKIDSTLFVPLAPLQAQWYSRLLHHAAEGGNGLGDLMSRDRLTALWIQLRKAHWYSRLLHHAAEGGNVLGDLMSGDPLTALWIQLRKKLDAMRSMRNAEGAEFIKFVTAPTLGRNGAALEAELRSLVGPTLITSSAKLVLLEALLRRLKASGSRVLLFSQAELRSLDGLTLVTYSAKLMLLEALLRRPQGVRLPCAPL
eukprot:gene9259-16409_t